MAFPDNSTITGVLVQGVSSVVENASVLLQTMQENPVAVVVTTAVVVAVAVGMTVLPCGKTAPKAAIQTIIPDRPAEVKKKAPSLAIADLWGVYQPISTLLPKDVLTTAKHSTYKSGYKSTDDKGGFSISIPRPSIREPWIGPSSPPGTL